MLREKGAFSNRYYTRRGKQNTQHNHEEVDFPLAYTSNKYASKEKSQGAVTARKKKEDKQKSIVVDAKPEQGKSEQVIKLEKELKDARQQIKRSNKEHMLKHERQEHKISQLNHELQQQTHKAVELTAQLSKLTKKNKQTLSSNKRYRETIKDQIYWLLRFYVHIESSQPRPTIDEIKRQVENNYRDFHEYIQEFGIQKQLQELASTSSIKQEPVYRNTEYIWGQQLSQINANSMFTEEVEENNIIKAMELQPLIQTFNYNQQEMPESETKITKKLFTDSPLFNNSGNPKIIKTNISIAEDSLNVSKDGQNQFMDPMANIVLPRQVTITHDYVPAPGDQNYISLSKGKPLKLLRRIRDQLWIGEYLQKLGLVHQSHFKL